MHARPLLVILVLVLVTAAVALAACGDGSRPAPGVSTLLPSPTSTEALTLSPRPGATVTSPGATPTSTSGGDDGGGDDDGGGGAGATVSDATIRAGILARLAQAPELNGLAFKVRVRDGVVYLTGVVKTPAQKSAAEQIAVTEPGIVKVLSYLFVEPEGSGGY